jgi:hypothetical protein
MLAESLKLALQTYGGLANTIVELRNSSEVKRAITDNQGRFEFDGDGVSKTGGPTVDFTSYDSFLSSPVSVTYVPDDNDVVVTLHARASNYSNQLANAGTYTATQTLTAHWVGP